MKHFRLTFISVFLLLQSFNAQAFLSAPQEQRVLAQLNARFLRVNFEDIRCSLRSRHCLLHFSSIKGQHSCFIGLISDPSDVIQENEDKGLIRLAPYAEDVVTRCLSEIQ